MVVIRNHVWFLGQFLRDSFTAIQIDLKNAELVELLKTTYTLSTVMTDMNLLCSSSPHLLYSHAFLL